MPSQFEIEKICSFRPQELRPAFEGRRLTRTVILELMGVHLSFSPMLTVLPILLIIIIQVFILQI